MKMIIPINGLDLKKEKPVVTPIHAPNIVGNIERANKAKVLRNTLLRVMASDRPLRPL